MLDAAADALALPLPSVLPPPLAAPAALADSRARLASALRDLAAADERAAAAARDAAAADARGAHSIGNFFISPNERAGETGAFGPALAKAVLVASGFPAAHKLAQSLRADDWRCPHCGENNYGAKVRCYRWGCCAPRPIEQGEWLCSCGTPNGNDLASCRRTGCGRPEVAKVLATTLLVSRLFHDASWFHVQAQQARRETGPPSAPPPSRSDPMQPTQRTQQTQ